MIPATPILMVSPARPHLLSVWLSPGVPTGADHVQRGTSVADESLLVHLEGLTRSTKDPFPPDNCSQTKLACMQQRPSSMQPIRSCYG